MIEFKPRAVTTAAGTRRFVCSSCMVTHPTMPEAFACCSKPEAVEAKNIAPEMLDRIAPKALAPELLGRAAALMHERGKQYDAPAGERSMGQTVAAFNAITGRDLTESEGWLLMCVLKAVRAQARKEPHADSLEDLIAYAALLAEARLAGR